MIDNASENQRPAALLRVAGKAVIHRQISQLRKLGVERFIISTASMNSYILQFTNDLRRVGIEVEYVRSLHALGDMLSEDDQFLLMSEAVLCDDKYLETLCGNDVSQILALENIAEYEQFELIDLEHRWAGLAKIDGKLISALDMMPEDSDIHSTLLRLALQNGCALNIIEPNPDDIFKVVNQKQAKQLSNIYLQNLDETIGEKGLTETYIFMPVTKMILPKLWANVSIGKSLHYMPLIIGITALISLYFQWYILAFIIIFIVRFVSYLLQKYNHFNEETRYGIAGDIVVSILLLLILLFSVPSATIDQYIITMILFLLCYSIQYLSFNNRINKFLLSFSDIFLILIIASIWSSQGYAIMGIVLALTFWVFIGAVVMPRSNREGN